MRRRYALRPHISVGKGVRLGIVALLLTLQAIPAAAISLSLHGAIKNESAYFVAGERRWDKLQSRLDLQPEAVLGHGWQWRSRALLWYDAAMDLERTRAPDLTAAIKRHYRTATQLKEGYLFLAGDAFDLRLGRQQIIWGKTDGLRLLDIVNPLDLREFILDDFLDSRIGVTAARLNYYPDSDIEQEIELLLVPDAKTAALAPGGSRWAFATPPLPPGVTALRQLATKRPNWSARNSEAGIAWRGNDIGGWDLSLNYYYGWKETPNARRAISGGVMTLQLVHLRMQTLGGSFSNAFGAFVVRGELALNLREGIDTASADWQGSVTRKTTFNSALALEWSRYNWNISGQLFLRHINGWDATLLEPRASGFWSLRVATDFLHEKLKPELLLLADWAAGGWLARPKASYEWSDNLTLALGGDLFGGRRGLLGQFADNDRLYGEAEYSF